MDTHTHRYIHIFNVYVYIYIYMYIYSSSVPIGEMPFSESYAKILSTKATLKNKETRKKKSEINPKLQS